MALFSSDGNLTLIMYPLSVKVFLLPVLIMRGPQILYIFPDAPPMYVGHNFTTMAISLINYILILSNFDPS